MQFADKRRSMHMRDLKLLPSEAASFEPSQAPLSAAERKREKQASASEASNRGLSVAVSTNDFAESSVTLITGTLGPAFAS